MARAILLDPRVGRGGERGAQGVESPAVADRDDASSGLAEALAVRPCALMGYTGSSYSDIQESLGCISRERAAEEERGDGWSTICLPSFISEEWYSES